MPDGSGVLSEHEPVVKPKERDFDDHSPEDQKLLKHVNARFDEAFNSRKRYDKNWMKYYQFFRGKQWQDNRPLYLHSEVINLVFQTIQSSVPIQTDARPKWDFLPQEPQDREFVEILNQICQSDWERKNWLMNLTESVYDANIYGVGYASIEYDPHGRDGLGDTVFQSEDPFYMYPASPARNINDRPTSLYFVKAEPTNLELIKQKYPEKGKEVKPDIEDPLVEDKAINLNKINFRSPVDNYTIVQKELVAPTRGGRQALVLTLHEYCMDYDETEKKDEHGNASFDHKLKYPKGRKTVIANNVILEDGSNPYDDGKIPYARLLNYMLPREFFGISEVEQLESPQKMFNRIVSFILDTLVLMGNPIWVAAQDSGVDTDNLYNRPGLVVEPVDINKIRREPGVALQPYVLQILDRVATWFDGIHGLGEVTRGIRPEGITAAAAIENLQNASQTRLRLKSRLMDAWLQELGQMWISRTLQYRRAPEIVRLTNNKGATKYFKFSIEQEPSADNPEIKQNVLSLQDGRMDDAGNFLGFADERKIIQQGEIDVRVKTGSSLPFAKVEKFNQATRLYELGVIDEEELLKTAEWPNWEAVMDRVMQKKQAVVAQNQSAPQ